MLRTNPQMYGSQNPHPNFSAKKKGKKTGKIQEHRVSHSLLE